MDYYFNVRAGYYFAQWVLVIIGDKFFYKSSKKLIGERGARVAVYLYLTNKFYNTYIVKCFGNSVESILNLVILNYYIDIKHKFDRNVAMLTFLMVLSFMIRCTAPLGWIPLILYKLVKDNSFKAFLISGFLVAIPSLMLFIFIDSVYYGQYTFVVYNFIYKNLIEDISSSFGISPPFAYITNTIPYNINGTLLPCIVGICLNFKDMLCKHQFPFVLVLSTFYILVLSLVPHKEDRFILSTIPLVMIIASQGYTFLMKKWQKLFSLYLVLSVIHEIVMNCFFFHLHRQLH
jgi:phosphatidylinositol glycan class B